MSEAPLACKEPVITGEGSAGGDDMTELPPLDRAVLPAGVRARFIDGINGLSLHILEAGFESPGRPLVLLLHGFPELAYS